MTKQRVEVIKEDKKANELRARVTDLFGKLEPRMILWMVEGARTAQVERVEEKEATIVRFQEFPEGPQKSYPSTANPASSARLARIRELNEARTRNLQMIEFLEALYDLIHHDDIRRSADGMAEYLRGKGWGK